MKYYAKNKNTGDMNETKIMAIVMNMSKHDGRPWNTEEVEDGLSKADGLLMDDKYFYFSDQASVSTVERIHSACVKKEVRNG